MFKLTRICFLIRKMIEDGEESLVIAAIIPFMKGDFYELVACS